MAISTIQTNAKFIIFAVCSGNRWRLVAIQVSDIQAS